MTTEQREAIDRLNKDKNKPLACGDITIVNISDLDTALSLIKQKDRQIDLMANYIVDLIKYNNPEEIRETEEIKQYYERKVKNEKEKRNRNSEK